MNGYGPANSVILTFILNMIAKYIGFKLANANKHDISYNEGGTEADKIRADTGFLRYLLIDANGIWYKVILAYVFYFAVRIFGKKYFNYK